MSDWYSDLPRAGESYPSKKKKRRSAKAWATRIIVLVGFVAFMFGVYSVVDRGRDWLQAKASETTVPSVASSVKVIVSPGMTASQIGELLESKGVVSSAAAFVDLVASRGSEEKLQPGTYQLPTSAQLVQVVARLEQGRAGAPTFQVTVPEGMAASQVASLLAKGGEVKQAATYIDLAQQPDKFVVPKVGGDTPKVATLEGLLFPDTYELMTGDGPTELIGAQLAAFAKKTTTLQWEAAEFLGLSPYQIVIVASMLEKEANTPEDMAKVAAVIYNRLKKKMRLDVDATVRYALDKWTEPLTTADLKVDSPYNTRVVKGLPPAPIANPGVAALKAALEPADVDYLYYLTGKDGKTYFTASYDEFVQMKKDLLQ
jgi:UPF0755 protein